MKGTLTTQGSYFIPLKESAQLTIDCTLIPVVELDDGTTALLDFGNRLSGPLPATIRQTWAHSVVVPAGQLQDGLTGLQAIIGPSRQYQMTRTEKPLPVAAGQEVLVHPDWVISAKRPAGAPPHRQGLFVRTAGEPPLPEEARRFLERHGLAVTEIVDGRAAEPAPQAPTTPSAAVSLQGQKGIALAEQLLRALGEQPARGGELVLFEQARDGFNLSLHADLLCPRGDRRLLIHGKPLPGQFLQRLSELGTDVLIVGPQESGRALVERLLQTLKLPYSAGHFTLRIPAEGVRPRLSTAFSALRVNHGGTQFYLLNLDRPPEVLSLFQGPQTGTLITY
jgi:hypothetical protein